MIFNIALSTLLHLLLYKIWF